MTETVAAEVTAAGGMPCAAVDCKGVLRDGDLFCSLCGKPGASVEWSLASDRSAPTADHRSEVRVRPGESCFVVATNRGIAPVRVELEAQGLSGFRLLGGPNRRVAPGQSQAYELEHVPGEEIRGVLLRRSEDAAREQWWERRGWRSTELRVARHFHLREERWKTGSDLVLFPPGVRRQAIRFWNDSDRERPLHLEAPHGYRLHALGRTADRAAVAVPSQQSAEIVLHVAAGTGADPLWRAHEDAAPVQVTRLGDLRPAGGADVVIAIDFGTRNTGVRVRWRRTLVAAKPAGTVDAVGDVGSTPRFPTQMVIHRHERSLRWGKDAADYIAASRMTADEVAVGNLKSALREGAERFTGINPAWTNDELVGRYFERLFGRIDEYFRTADPNTPLRRDSVDVRYVVCRPVLDANEGDEVGRRYEEALRQALERCGVAEAAVSFVHEPVAAAVGIARRRDAALLSLPDGTAVAVVDSGGGTTDIALARVRLSEGRVSLDLAGSYALRLGPDSPAVVALDHFGVDDRELGGNVLDWCLAHRLATRAADLLESDSKAVPERIFYGATRSSGEPGTAPTPSAAALRNFVLNCRRMKERFARVSTQYLNRAPGQPREPGEVLPYPNREDLQGVYLVHSLYEEKLLRPILKPVIEALAERVGQATPPAVKPTEVRRVFYVGGTNIDPFVRLHFGRAFPLAEPEHDPDAQADARIEERLHAVVEGAVWSDEQLFPPSPVAVTVALAGKEHRVIAEGAAIPPLAVAAPRFFTHVLEIGEELDAALLVSGEHVLKALNAEAAQVARAIYRNESETAQEITLAVQVSRERGVTGEVRWGTSRREQWRFLLVDAETSVEARS